MGVETPVGDDEMAGSVVNLDALIPREDMVLGVVETRGPRLEKVDITHLDQGFFVSVLRKPDFQRETSKWSPEKVVDLIQAFVGGDLIPAVILWQRGPNVFVIDGAHRLGALIAWVNDDYGDGRQSLEYFGGHVPDEQRRIADRVRKMVNSDVGPYAQLKGARQQPQNANPIIQGKLANLAVNAIVAQWVPQLDDKAAEDSFFKINQAATPIDQTEKQILRSRKSANSIASRAIVGGGRGHKYWSGFLPDIQAGIESSARSLHSALYDPPLGTPPLKTLDVPVAGRGYAALPFVYELVNWANNIPEPKAKEESSVDLEGKDTVSYLKRVSYIVSLITGNDPDSLGLHPLVYFYTRGGDFQPMAFISTAAWITDLSIKNRLLEFTVVRERIESFILSHKEFITLIIKRTGAGRRSLPRTVRYLNFIMDLFLQGKTEDDVIVAIKGDTEFQFLGAAMDLPTIREGDNPTRRFSRTTKSASYVATAIKSAVKCGICHGYVHRNSLHFDHIDPVRDGGGTDVSNARVTHPYCDSSRG